MFQPRFTITPAITKALMAIEADRQLVGCWEKILNQIVAMENGFYVVNIARTVQGLDLFSRECVKRNRAESEVIVQF